MLGPLHQWSSAVVCNCTCSFHVNNTNKGHSAVLNWSPDGCSLSRLLRPAPRFIYSDIELVMRPSLSTSPAFSRCSCVNNTVPYEGQSGFSGIRSDLVHVTFNHHICWGATKYNTLIPLPLRLFRNMDASLGITSDLINHFGFYYLKVKSAYSFSLYFEINPPVYARASSSVSCSD